MMQLRPYQTKLYDGLLAEARAGHKAILAVLPTGGGKTVVAAALMENARAKGRTAWFACHRDFLVEQTSGTLRQFGLPHGFIAAGRADGIVQSMVVSVDTLRSRLARFSVRPHLVIWDEAHHSRAASWQRVWEWMGPGVTHLGLTATPERLDGRGLGPIPGEPGGFTAMVQGPTTRELMEMGNLSGYRAFAPGKIDLSGVRTTAGDYDKHQLAEAVEKAVITGDVIAHYQTKAAGLRAVYFCVSVAYSKRLARAFCEAGIPASHIDGTSTAEERFIAARALATGRIKVICNVALLGEGFDLEAVAGMPCSVEAVGLIRPTQSLALHLQQIGRALRPKPHPAVVLDHAGNFARHGFPDDDRLWDLNGRKKGPPRDALVKTCRECLAVNPIQATHCSECGAPFGVVRTGPAHVPGKLVEIDVNARRLARWKEEEAADTLEKLIALGKKRGYKPFWAHKFYAARQAARARRLREAKIIPFPKRR